MVSGIVNYAVPAEYVCQLKISLSRSHRNHGVSRADVYLRRRQATSVATDTMDRRPFHATAARSYAKYEYSNSTRLDLNVRHITHNMSKKAVKQTAFSYLGFSGARLFGTNLSQSLVATSSNQPRTQRGLLENRMTILDIQCQQLCSKTYYAARSRSVLREIDILRGFVKACSGRKQ